jgi:hypothetical protein
MRREVHRLSNKTVKLCSDAGNSIPTLKGNCIQNHQPSIAFNGNGCKPLMAAQKYPISSGDLMARCVARL